MMEHFVVGEYVEKDLDRAKVCGLLLNIISRYSCI
jgi:hypothetical protein